MLALPYAAGAWQVGPQDLLPRFRDSNRGLMRTPKHGALCMCVDCLGGGFEEDECPSCSKQLIEGCCMECGECYE